LRNGTAPPRDSGLRALQTALQRDLQSSGEAEHVRAMAWMEGSDRITNAINTIAHLLGDKAKGPSPA